MNIFLLSFSSIAFNSSVLECEYLHVVEQLSEYFEKGLIVKALKEYDKLRREHTHMKNFLNI